MHAYGWHHSLVFLESALAYKQNNRATPSGVASSSLATNADIRFVKQDVGIAGSSCETPGELGELVY